MKHRMNAHLATAARVMLLTLALLVMSGLWGCVLPEIADRTLPKYMKAGYAGLAGQSAGVMVWADRGVRIDWSSIRIDLAQTVQTSIYKNVEAPELEGTTWPVAPASIVRYQQDNPATDAMPVLQLAPKLGVTRLIYIELTEFRTRSPVSMQLFRGHATYTLKVIEINGQDARVGYEDSGLVATYTGPGKASPEGVTNGTDVSMYQGTIAEIAKQVSERLVTHQTN